MYVKARTHYVASGGGGGCPLPFTLSFNRHFSTNLKKLSFVRAPPPFWETVKIIRKLTKQIMELWKF